MFFRNSFRIFVILFLFLVVIFPVYSSDMTFSSYRDSYKSFETVQLDVSINGISLSSDLQVSNLVLLNSDNSSISLAKTKVKLADNHYVFYFDLPSLDPGVYNLGFQNVNYVKDGSSLRGDFFSSLNIVEGNESIISVRPAYVLTSVSGIQEAVVTLVVSNKGGDVVSVNLAREGDFFDFDSESFNLVPGGSKAVVVQTSVFDRNAANFSGSINVNYGVNSYSIPFIVTKLDYVPPVVANVTNVSNGSEVVNVSSNSLYLSTFSESFLEKIEIDHEVGDYYPSGQIVVKNNASVDLHNLNYFVSGLYSGMYEIDPSGLEFLEEGGSAIFLLGVNDEYDFMSGTYESFLVVNSTEGASVSIPLTLRVSRGVEFVDENVSIDLFGDENVSTNGTLPVDYGERPEKSKTGVYLLILLIVVALLLILFLIYRKTKKKEDEFEGFVDRVKDRSNF